MTPDTEICRKIAENIVDNGGVFIDPGFSLSNEASGDREYLINEMTEILSTRTALPKMVEALHEIANTETYHPEFRYGGPASISIQIGAWHQEQFLGVVRKAQQALAELQDKTDTKQNGAGEKN